HPVSNLLSLSSISSKIAENLRILLYLGDRIHEVISVLYAREMPCPHTHVLCIASHRIETKSCYPFPPEELTTKAPKRGYVLHQIINRILLLLGEIRNTILHRSQHCCRQTLNNEVRFPHH